MQYFRNKNYGYSLVIAEKKNKFIEVYNTNAVVYIRRIFYPRREYFKPLKKQAFMSRYKQAVSLLYTKRLYLRRKKTFYLVDNRGFVETVDSESNYIRIEMRKERASEVTNLFVDNKVKKTNYFRYNWEKIKVTLRLI